MNNSEVIIENNNSSNSLSNSTATTATSVIRGIAISDDYNHNNDNKNDYFNGRYNLTHSSISIPSIADLKNNNNNSNNNSLNNSNNSINSNSGSGNSVGSNSSDEEENIRLRSEYKKIIKNNSSKLELTKSKSRISIIDSLEDEISFKSNSTVDDSSNSDNTAGTINNDMVVANKQQIKLDKDVIELVEACDDLFKQKKIILKMLVSENFFQSNQLDKKKLVTFVKNIVDTELLGVSSTILRSSQFKTLYLDYYRDLFQSALNSTNSKYNETNPLTIYHSKKESNLLLTDSNYFTNFYQQQQILQQQQQQAAQQKGLPHSSNILRYQREFREISKLGSGGFGSVFLAGSLLDSQNYAIKKVNFSISNSQSPTNISTKIDKLIREIRTLAKLSDHVNILRYYNAWLELDTTSVTVGKQYSSVEGSLRTNGISGNSSGDNSSSSSSIDISSSNSSTSLNITNGTTDEITSTFGKSSLNNSISISLNDSRTQESVEYSISENFNKSSLSDLSDEDEDEEEEDSFESNSSSSGSDELEDEESLNEDTENKNNILKSLTVSTSLIPYVKRRNKKKIYNPSSGSSESESSESDLENKKKPSSSTTTTKSTSPLKNSDNGNGTNIPTRLKYTIYIQTQYCEGKTLKDLLESSDFKNKSKTSVLLLFKQIITGLNYIHSTNITHRDIKPANLFLSKDGIIKIGDFGLSKDITNTTPTTTPTTTPITTPTSSAYSVPITNSNNCNSGSGSGSDNNSNTTPPSTTPPLTSSQIIASPRNLYNTSSTNLLSSSTNTTGIGTLTYASPEQLKGKSYTNKVDIYSCGIILFEMIIGGFETQYERVCQIKNLKNGILPNWFKVQYPDESNLILRMIDLNPDKRPSASQLLDELLPILLETSEIDHDHGLDYEKLDQQTLLQLLKKRDKEIILLNAQIQLLKQSSNNNNND